MTAPKDALVDEIVQLAQRFPGFNDKTRMRNMIRDGYGLTEIADAYEAAEERNLIRREYAPRVNQHGNLVQHAWNIFPATTKEA